MVCDDSEDQKIRSRNMYEIT